MVHYMCFCSKKSFKVFSFKVRDKVRVNCKCGYTMLDVTRWYHRGFSL